MNPAVISRSAKEGFARLLATENLSVVHDKVETASFDTRNRILTLPIYKEEMGEPLINMFVAHEVSHALYTPEDWLEEFPKEFQIDIDNIEKEIEDRPEQVQKFRWFKDLVNIIEDSRIDKMMKKKFPGLRGCYKEGMKEIIEKEIFKYKDQKISNDVLKEMGMVDRINMHFKAEHLTAEFNDEEKELVQIVDKVACFSDVIDAAQKLYEWLEKNPEDMAKYQCSEATSNIFKKGKGEKGDSGKGACSKSTFIGSDNKGTVQAPHTTQKILDDAVKYINDGNAANREYLMQPGVNLSKAIVPFSEISPLFEPIYKNLAVKVESELSAFKRKTKDLISYLFKQFELKRSADEYSRTKLAKTGQIDPNKLKNYLFRDDIFRRIEVVMGGKNHGLIMFVDWSSSMDSIIYETIQQTLALVMFCRMAKIKFQVLAFSSGYSKNQVQWKNSYGCCEAGNLALLELISSNMKHRVYTQAFKQLFAYGLAYNLKNQNISNEIALHGTPLNEAALVASYLVPEFQKRNNIQIMNTIFLTDGDSNGINLNRKFRSGGFVYSQKSDPFVYIQDKETKKNYLLADYVRETNLFVDMLREKTDSNVVCFHLLNSCNFDSTLQSRVDRDVYRHGTSSRKITINRSACSKKYKNDGFFIIDQKLDPKLGYSEYYLINVDSFKERTNATIVDRHKQKVLLNRFIEMIK